MKALIIRPQWIDKIIAGEKTWEMRSTSTNVRGDIALVRAQSGLVVGTARLVDCLPALTRSNYMDCRDRHAIPPEKFEEVWQRRWIYPWVLESVRPLAYPVPSMQKPGPVIFFDLEPSVVTVIASASASSLPAHPTGTDTQARELLSSSHRRSPKIEKPMSSIDINLKGKNDASSDSDFVFRPERAQAFGIPLSGGRFLVRRGSTAMRRGAPNVKRDIDDRDSLLRRGILVQDTDPALYKFAAEHTFSSSSKAAGVIKDGNASGPSLWKHVSTGETLKDFLVRCGP